MNIGNLSARNYLPKLPRQVKKDKAVTIYPNLKKWRIFGFIDDNAVRTC
jgi:hypothetical protein